MYSVTVTSSAGEEWFPLAVGSGRLVLLQLVSTTALTVMNAAVPRVRLMLRMSSEFRLLASLVGLRVGTRGK